MTEEKIQSAVRYPSDLTDEGGAQESEGA